MFKGERIKELEKKNEELLKDIKKYKQGIDELTRINRLQQEKISILDRSAGDSLDRALKRDWEYRTLYADYNALESAYEKLIKNKESIEKSPTTFDMIEVGDIVCGAGKHSADIRVVEGVVKNEGENNNVLLANSRKDLFYEGTDEIKIFNREWRLLCRAKDLKEDI